MRKFNLFNHSSGQEERQITTSCLSLYSDLPLTCPLPDSLSLVSRQSDLATCAAERKCHASGARVAEICCCFTAVSHNRSWECVGRLHHYFQRWVWNRRN